MRIDQVVADMLRDRGLQRRAQAAMIATGDAWRAEPEVAPIMADLERFGAGADLAECRALAEAFTGSAAAPALAASLCRTFADALEREEMGQLPFRNGFDGHVSSLMLARSGRAQLALHAREPGLRDHACVGLSDAVRFEAVLAGSARARIVRTSRRGKFAERQLELGSGARLRLDLSCEALLVDRVDRRLVTLRLQRAAARPRPNRDLRLADGAQLHQSAGDIRYSRQEMMLALLGRMGRAEAAQTMAAMACEPGDESLRWQALRECLALDTAQGFDALSTVACAADDPLAAAAGALRAHLIEAHPRLRAMEDEPCRA